MSLATMVKSWRQFPICLFGFDIRRWEYGGNRGDVYCQGYVKKLLFWKKSQNCGPTHLQYFSPFGFLLTWPLCLHVWYQFKEQATDLGGDKIPGSETVFYWRFGARWDAQDSLYVVPSWYGPGLRWD